MIPRLSVQWVGRHRFRFEYWSDYATAYVRLGPWLVWWSVRQGGRGVNQTTLYDDAKAAGIKMDHHESDLYIIDGEPTRALFSRHADAVTMASRFVSNADGLLWWDVPFGYLPWWRARQESSALDRRDSAMDFRGRHGRAPWPGER